MFWLAHSQFFFSPRTCLLDNIFFYPENSVNIKTIFEEKKTPKSVNVMYDLLWFTTNEFTKMIRCCDAKQFSLWPHMKRKLLSNALENATFILRFVLYRIVAVTNCFKIIFNWWKCWFCTYLVNNAIAIILTTIVSNIWMWKKK